MTHRLHSQLAYCKTRNKAEIIPQQQKKSKKTGLKFLFTASVDRTGQAPTSQLVSPLSSHVVIIIRSNRCNPKLLTSHLATSLTRSNPQLWEESCTGMRPLSYAPPVPAPQFALYHFPTPSRGDCGGLHLARPLAGDAVGTAVVAALQPPRGRKKLWEIKNFGGCLKTQNS
jgi:hypothetical protein